MPKNGGLHVGDTVERWLPGVLPYGETDHDPAVADDAQRAQRRRRRHDAKGARYLGRVHDRILRARLTAIGRRIDASSASGVSPLW